MSELRERVKVGEGGQITIPKKLREHLKIKEGSILEMYPIKDNKVVMEVLVH